MPLLFKVSVPLLGPESGVVLTVSGSLSGSLSLIKTPLVAVVLSVVFPRTV